MTVVVDWNHPPGSQIRTVSGASVRHAFLAVVMRAARAILEIDRIFLPSRQAKEVLAKVFTP